MITIDAGKALDSVSLDFLILTLAREIQFWRFFCKLGAHVLYEYI